MPETILARPRIAFVQLLKYDRDTGTFEGVMASSAPDQSKEILDWKSSRPHFQRWFSSCAKRTSNASIGNVREMHQPIAAGILTKATFDDEHERIHVRGRVFDPSTKEKLANAVLTGLSIGGDYGKRWADPANPGFTRYTAIPHEVSLVDNPCNEEAVLTLVKGGAEQTIPFAGHEHATEIAVELDDDPYASDDELRKAAFATHSGERVPKAQHAYAPSDNASDWKFPIHDADHVKAALSRFGQDKGIPESARPKVWARILRAADAHGVHVSDRSYKKAEGTTMTDTLGADELRKQEIRKANARAALGEMLKRLKRVRKGKKDADGLAGMTLKELADVAGLHKSYVRSVSGNLEDLQGQLREMEAAFTPAVAAGMPQSPGKLQPDETTDGADGSMVTVSPSSAGEGAMIVGEGNRKGKGKGSLSKKKLLRLLDERDSRLSKSLGETLVALLKPPTPDEEAKFAAAAGARPARPAATITAPVATGGAPVRLVKDAADAGKVPVTDGGGADAIPAAAVIENLKKIAADMTDPLAASRAQATLLKISEDAVSEALRDTAQVPDAVSGAGFRPVRTA